MQHKELGNYLLLFLVVLYGCFSQYGLNNTGFTQFGSVYPYWNSIKPPSHLAYGLWRMSILRVFWLAPKLPKTWTFAVCNSPIGTQHEPLHNRFDHVMHNAYIIEVFIFEPKQTWLQYFFHKRILFCLYLFNVWNPHKHDWSNIQLCCVVSLSVYLKYICAPL